MIFPASEDKNESLRRNDPNVQLFGFGVYPRLGKLNGNNIGQKVSLKMCDFSHKLN